MGTYILKSSIVTWILLLLIWTLAAKYNTPDFLPNPKVTWDGFLEVLKKGVLWADIKISIQRVLLGFLRGALIAVPLGLLIGRFKVFKWLFEPFISFFRFVPAIGFLSLFLMWFGIGEESKLALITYAVIFPVTVNTIAGVAGIDPVKYQAAESLGASRLQSFLTVTIPGAVPNIFTGLRLGLSSAIISIVGAEMLAASEGLGYLIYTSRMYYRTDWIFVGIVVLGLIGFFADKLLRKVAAGAFRYYGVVDK
ncbi:MAG: ABC transporter permease [Lachnospiraceae bacterium]|nr:ABC transporter permease [Lachnospiraceae bacterium]